MGRTDIKGNKASTNKKLIYFVLVYGFGLTVISIVFLKDAFSIRQTFNYLPTWFESYVWLNLIGKLFALILLSLRSRLGLYLLLFLIIIEYILGAAIFQTSFWFWPQFIFATTNLILWCAFTIRAVRK